MCKILAIIIYIPGNIICNCVALIYSKCIVVVAVNFPITFSKCCTSCLFMSCL